jgi:hypothetical protein
MGRVYELYESIKSGELKGKMELLTITADDAVKEGVITQEYLDKQKIILGVMYDQYFNADFIVGQGNVFRPDDIKACLTDTIPTINHDCPISMGVDPGFGSSKFGIAILQYEDGIVKTIYANETANANYQSMVDLCVQLRYTYKPVKIFVDANRPEFIKSLKVALHENPEYKPIMEQAKKDKVSHDYRMFVVPISFNEYGAELLGAFQHFVSKHWFSMSQSELVKQMSSAKFKDNANLDKAEVGDENTYDLFDAVRLAFFNFGMRE